MKNIWNVSHILHLEHLNVENLPLKFYTYVKFRFALKIFYAVYDDLRYKILMTGFRHL